MKILVNAGSLCHKMMGVEILHAFQLIFLLQTLSRNSTHIFGLLKNISIVFGNFLYLTNTQINVYHSKYISIYNPKNQAFSQALIVGINILFLLCCLLPLLWKWKEILADPTINSNSFTKIDAYVKAIYTHCVFPMAIGFLMINFLTITTIVENQLAAMFSTQCLQISCLLELTIILISSFVWFFEFKVLSTKKGYRRSL